MTIALPLRTSIFEVSHSALSEEAEIVAHYGKTIDEPDRSITLGERSKSAMMALFDAYSEATVDGWDGYDARRAHLDAVVNALNFLNLLPTSTPIPEIAIDVDGEVAVEWDYGPRCILSVRVGRDRTLNYAGIDGYATFNGKEILQECIPTTILAAIDRVVRGNCP